DLLKQHGITDVVLTLHYMAEMIMDYFGDGQQLGMNIQYSIEETPLGTAGSVKQAQALLDETFIIISGDAVTDIDLSAAIRFHQEKKALATLTLYRVANPLEYGVVIVDGEGRIQQFLEKPSWGEVISDTVNTGIYILEPQVLDYIEPGVSYDFSKDLFPRMLAKGDPMYGYVAGGYWCDVGNIVEYARASGDILRGQATVAELGKHISSGVWCGEGVEIAPDAQLYGPIYLGDGVKLKQGVIVHGPTVIQDYSVVDRYAHIERSIVWRNCYIGESVELRGAIIGQQCNIKGKAVVFEGAVVGDSSVLGEGAVIHPGVKIWPGKEVEAGATVHTSIIWGAQGRHVLFGRFGVTGLVNVDLTPELAARLGAAFGATLPKGSVVTINRDPHRSSRMLKRGMISGLPSSGVHVADLRQRPIPVARYMTRSLRAAGGVHVRLSPFDSRVVDIKFFDGKGQDLDKNLERNIERAFFREDFRRVYMEEIGTFDYAPGVGERYTEAFMKALNVDAIRAASPFIAVDFANSTSAEILSPILTGLRCRVVALNEALDESKMAISAAEFQESLRQLGKICGAIETAMGVRLDVGGERLFVVDCGGALVSGVRLLAALATMALNANPGGTIAVPVSMPDIFERIAAEHGGQVLRTRVNAQALMQAGNEPGVVLAGDPNGALIWPQFQPVVDGMMTLAKILEYTSTSGLTLQEMMRAVPDYHLAMGVVNCPWEAKGTVMRLLNENYRDRLASQVDGVKIQLGDNEWVLVLPDPDRPLFHVHAQADSDEQAGELVARYQRIVEGLQS
ncbi:MAG: mannose-1-phosphate guanyltransferase, partial [Chloroflexota bacterium]